MLAQIGFVLIKVGDDKRLPQSCISAQLVSFFLQIIAAHSSYVDVAVADGHMLLLHMGTKSGVHHPPCTTAVELCKGAFLPDALKVASA